MSVFKIFGKKHPPDPYEENAPGDFYVENGVCTACGAPEAEAPDLIAHSKLEYGHCYFKKQPKTEDEIERAINAIAVSCISGLRYGGKDEKILKRLYEIGEADQCDHKPIGNYKPIIWNQVTFNYMGTMKELYDRITSQVILEFSHFRSGLVNIKINNVDWFEFTHRWTDGLTGTIYKCNLKGNGQCKVEMVKEIDGYAISLRGSAMTLNLILSNDKNVSEIKWFDMDGRAYDKTQVR